MITPERVNELREHLARSIEAKEDVPYRYVATEDREILAILDDYAKASHLATSTEESQGKD